MIQLNPVSNLYDLGAIERRSSSALKTERRRPTTMDPRLLKPHPLNVQVYGAAQPDADFVKSVRELGVLEALHVTADNVLISGHWRRAAAVAVGLTEVPAVIHTGLSDLEVEQLLISMNQRRPKTNEQIAREYSELLRIEKALSEKRRGRPSAEKAADAGRVFGEARKIAARQVGLSHTTARQAADVVQQIDAAEAAGDQKTAATLRHKLNNESIAEAHRAATAEPDEKKQPLLDACGNIVPERLRAVFADLPVYKRLRSQITKLKAEAKVLASKPSGRRIVLSSLQADQDNSFRNLGFAMPHSLCPHCDGSDETCKACKGIGWVNEMSHKMATEVGKP